MCKSDFKLFMAALVGLFMLFNSNIFAGIGYDKQKVVYHINYDNPKKQVNILLFGIRG